MQIHLCESQRWGEMASNIRGNLFAALSLCGLSACALPPPATELPRAALPDAFSEELAAEGSAPAERICWRDFLPADMAIEPLVERAIAHNRDLAIAAARIDETRAQLRQRRANNGLNVQSNVEATINRTTSAATAAGALLEELFPDISGELGLPDTATFPLYQSTLAVSSFELDLWGRLRSLSAAARARVLAAEWNRKAVQLALLREIVSVSVRKLELGEQRRATQRLLALDTEQLAILERREAEGLSTHRDVLDQRERIDEIQIALARLSLDETVLTNTLEFISGESAWAAPDQAFGSPWASRSRIDAGLPSRLLLLRPDIKAAESRLLAVRADVSAARARLFPSINLTAAFGYASTDLGSLLSGDAMIFSGGGVIDLPIFDRPARLANVDLTKAREREAVAEYQKAVGSAFREVKDALAARRWYSLNGEAIARQVAALEQQVGIAREWEKAGLTNGLETLAVERRWLQARVRQASNAARLAEADVAVFVSLGGGDERICGVTPRQGGALGTDSRR